MLTKPKKVSIRPIYGQCAGVLADCHKPEQKASILFLYPRLPGVGDEAYRYCFVEESI